MPRWPQLTIKERFYAHVKKLSGRNACHEYQGARSKKGYGQFGYEGWIQAAHRVAWKLEYGNIPAGLCILHRCDNPACVRLSHLFLGTQLDNIADRVAKGRTASGEAHFRAKLTNEQVIAIRTAYATGQVLQRELAQRYSCSGNTISAIVTSVSWKAVGA